jgi:plastocyanin
VRGGVPRSARFSAAALAAVGVLASAGAVASPQPHDLRPQRHIVEIRGMAFHPAVLEVRRGDTVVWINQDIVPHTATSTRKSGWSTGSLLQGQSGRDVPNAIGEEPYVCELHPTMQGKLIIR